MHRTRLILTGTAIAALIAIAGCDPASSPDASTPAAAPTTPSTASASSPAADPAADAATAKACDDIKADLKDNDKKVAKAEKIGPPAGHIAVSAQWTAGSTAILAHSIGANDTVSAAADKVQAEMMSLSDAYNESAKAKPSKKKLEAAIKELEAACSGA
jgi:hypothetical protein